MVTTTTGIATEFIQFTRASNATVTDSDGKVKWAPHNLLTNSESFDAASWTKNISLIAANSIAAPNGTTTADKLYPSTSGTKSGVLARPTAVEEQYTLSVYAKAGGKNFITFTDFSAGSARAWANLSTGAKTETAGYFLTVTDAGSGWWRCEFTQTAKVASPYAFFIVCDADSSDAVTVNGTDGIYIWGAHLYRSDLAMQPNTSAYPMYNPTTPKNLLGYTEDFSNAAWVKVNTGSSNPIVTANVAIGPNGLQTADQIVFPATTSAQTSKLYQSGGTLFGPHTLSIYLRGNLGGEVVYLTGFNGASYFTTTCSLTTSWQRFSVSSATASGTVYLQLGQETAAGNGGISACTIYAWGAQLSDSASLDPYVPVYGAAVTSAAYYGPRRDFDPVTLACKGLLVEEQRANLVLQSAAFDNAAWTPFSLNTTGTPQWVNAAIAPDGTMTADKLIPNTSSTNVHAIASTATIAVANTTAHTWSVYAKADGYDWIAVVAYTNSISYLTWFNVATGAVGTNAAGNTAHPPVAVGNGWYRLSVTRTTASTVAQFILYAANADNQPTFAGDGTKGVLVWGAQLEAGSFATSYIPTGTATATRNADVASVSTQAFPYSATEGTVVVSATPMALGGIAYALNDESAANRIQAQMSSTNYHFYVDVGSVLQANLAPGTLTANTTAKLAGAYKANDFAASDNGSAVATDTSGSVPVCTTLHIGRLVASGYLNGHIRQITYLPRRVSNAELVTRST